jgi:Flp pilus assembly pilin Flp
MKGRFALWAMALTGKVDELRERRDGQAVIEYAVLLALILVGAIVMIGLLGDQVTNTFTSVCKAVKGSDC